MYRTHMIGPHGRSLTAALAGSATVSLLIAAVVSWLT
jgi:hypothetical protein